VLTNFLRASLSSFAVVYNRGLNKYAGPKTKRKACTALPFFRQEHLDYRRAYKVEGIVYDEEGIIIGLAEEVNFKASTL